jgi:RNA polymerase sigma factor (sigma-70 family)
VTDAMRTLGAAATLSGPVFSSRGEIGVEADRFGTTYGVRDLGSAIAGPYLSETAAPIILAGFVEDRWQSPGGRWGVTTGLRSDVAPWGPVALEPRLTTHFAPTPTVSLGAAWGESRQYVQSLSNPESMLGAVVGVPLPVAADGKGLPVGRADQWTGALTLRPAPGTILTLDGYIRRMDGLLLVAPVTAEPFATDSIATGSGRASGILLSVEHQTSRVTIQALYAYGTTTRTALGTSYAPTAGATNSLAAGIGVRIPDGLVLRAALWAAFGRQTTLISDSVAWSPPSQLGGVGDLDGTPQSVGGPLDGQPLPAYVRLDLGVRREWTSILGHAMRVSGSVAVDNVLGRANVAALLAPGNAAPSDPLYYTGRTLSVRLEWNRWQHRRLACHKITAPRVLQLTPDLEVSLFPVELLPEPDDASDRAREAPGRGRPAGTVRPPLRAVAGATARLFDQEFRHAFEQHFASLFRYVDRWCGDAALAADVAQETFVRLYQRGRLPEELRAWLVSVANNLLRDEHRRSTRRQRLLERHASNEGGEGSDQRPDATLLAEERRRTVRAALEELPSRERSLLLLRHEGYSYRDLARALHIRETSVGTLLARAGERFRAAMEGRHDALD